MNDNWIKTSMVKPKEGATCLVTTQGDIALAKYSEGYFTQYDNDDVSYNNVTAWQYTDAPFEDEKFYLLGGYDCDRVFVVRPRRIEDIECINTFNKCITGKASILDYRNIGETYVLIFKAVGLVLT